MLSDGLPLELSRLFLLTPLRFAVYAQTRQPVTSCDRRMFFLFFLKSWLRRRDKSESPTEDEQKKTLAGIFFLVRDLSA